MRNLAEKWPIPPRWEAAVLQRDDVTARTVSGLNQLLVSGAFDAWNRASGMSGAGVGAADVASGDRYAVRVARDRMLVVSERLLSIEAGWHDKGFAVTAMDAALHVFEISGAGVDRLLARGTTLDPRNGSPAASLLFAGVNVVLYRFDEARKIRVHVDRGLAPYLWEWLEHSSSV